MGSGARDWGQRWQHAALATDGLTGLSEAGVKRSLIDAQGAGFHRSYKEHGIVALGDLEQHLTIEAARRGAQILFDLPVGSARPLPGGGVAVGFAGTDDVIRARTYIDATGGRSSVPAEHGLGLGPGKVGTRSYFLGHYPRQAGPIGVGGGTGRHLEHGSYAAIQLNHPRHGAHVDIVLDSKPSANLSPEALRALHRDLARRAGVSGEPLSQPYVVSVTERHAANARSHDVLVIGDGVARKQPAPSGRGVNLALVDGSKVVEPALTLGPGREAALDAWGSGTLQRHRAATHDPTRADSERRFADNRRRLEGGIRRTTVGGAGTQ